MQDPRPTPRTSPFRRLLARALRFLVPVAFTVALVWYMFTKIDFSSLWFTICHGVDYKWILMAMALSVFSHLFRAMRWQLQLNASDIPTPLWPLTCSIFGTYALNLVFPRLGELWRCTFISARQKAPFAKVFGSMMADRLTDTLTVALLLLLSLLVANSQISGFLEKYPLGRDLVALLSNPLFWAILLAALLGLFLLFRLGRNLKCVRFFARKFAEIWNGFAVVARMKGRRRFLLLTLCIWGCYYFQLYLTFFAFRCTLDHCFGPATAFGLIPCLVAFVLSSIGMAIPSNGGLGPWNMAIIFGLMLYGVSEPDGASFSIVVWSAQTIMLVILGIITAAYVFADKKGRPARPAANPS